MEFFTNLAKFILICLNTLFALFAIVLIAIGAVILVNEDKGLESFTDFSVGGFAVGAGCVVLFIAGFGLFGALKKNGCLLTSYAIILILIFIVQVVVGAFAFVQLKNDDNELDKKVADIVRKVFDSEGDSQVINDVQQWFECCGVTGPSYWLEKEGKIPDSCYEDNDSTKALYQTSCRSAFQDLVSTYIMVIGIIGIVFAAIELFGAVFAFMVRNSIDSGY